MIAQNLSASLLTTLVANWAVVLAVLLVTLLSSTVVGWLLVRYSSLPGNTGAWGSSPGGAAAMVAMAQDYGADIRLVAFMQYLRVLFVAGAAVLVTRFIMGESAETVSQQIEWFPPSGNLFTTLLLAAVAGVVGRVLRIPSGTMLVPMLVGAVLHASGVMVIELPEWLLAIAYMIIGWQIGLGFDKQVFLWRCDRCRRSWSPSSPYWRFVRRWPGGSPTICRLIFSAYLATSPGGLDTVAVIAAGSHADMSLIMAMQTLRLFSILLTGPAIARFISAKAPRQAH